MSTELAVSAVSLALRNLMVAGVTLDDASGPLVIKKGIEHTVLPLDRVRLKHTTANVLNVFLYRVHANAAYRNQAFSGRTPLALNLEYLITAYGEDDRDEVGHYLLGKAMRVLHDHPVIARARLKTALAAARVHDQVENVRITPQDLSIEDLSKLWTMFQTQHYRISASYLVTVVLIDSKQAVKAPLPVLKRGETDTGWEAMSGASPSLESARATTGFSAVELGGELTLIGEHLDTGGLTAIVRHPLMAAPETLPVTPIDAGKAKVTLPAGPASKWIAGICSIALQVARPSRPPWLTNEVPFALAPSITVTPNVHNGANALFTLKIEAKPQIRASQPLLVMFGDDQVVPGPLPAPAGANARSIVEVKVKGPVGLYRVRLRVDGVDSIPIEPDGTTFKFDDAQSVQVKP
jgi:hypothetical protein